MADVKVFLSTLVECPICLSPFTDPRSLPCLHTLCFHCLEDYIRHNGRNGTFRCPVCRKDTQIPRDGARAFNKNFDMNNCVAVVNQQGTSMEEPDAPKCPTHKKKLEFYCSTCQLAFCSSAACIRTHASHAFQEIADVDEELKSELKEAAEVLQQLAGKLNVHREKAKQIQTLEKNVASARATTRELFQQIQHKLDQKANEMDKEFSKMTNEDEPTDAIMTPLFHSLGAHVMDLLNKGTAFTRLACMAEVRSRLQEIQMSSLDLTERAEHLKVPSSSDLVLQHLDGCQIKLRAGKDTHLLATVRIELQKVNVKKDRPNRMSCDVTVDGDILRCSHRGSFGPVGVFISGISLSPEKSYFEVELLNIGPSRAIGVGLTQYNHPVESMPGWVRDSVGYHSDDGRLFLSGCKRQFGPQCKAGDTIGCGIKFEQLKEDENDHLRVPIFFTRNGQELGTVMTQMPTESFYPVVGLHSRGQKVRLFLDA